MLFIKMKYSFECDQIKLIRVIDLNFFILRTPNQGCWIKYSIPGNARYPGHVAVSNRFTVSCRPLSKQSPGTTSTSVSVTTKMTLPVTTTTASNPNTITPPITTTMRPPATTEPTNQCFAIENQMNYAGNDLGSGQLVNSTNQCCSLCSSTDRCVGIREINYI
jgi:hypothetical protein